MGKLSKVYGNMKKLGHKMGMGGDCESCGGECMYADGGAVKPQPSPSSPSTDSIGDKDKRQKIADSFKSVFAKGGEVKGVHKPEHDKSGTSHAGAHIRDVRFEGANAKKAGLSVAKEEHKKTLAELKGMEAPKLKGLAHGGMIKGVHTSDMEIDRPKDKLEKSWAGESQSGQGLRNADINAAGMHKAKKKHHQVLSEMKSMSKPNLQGLAHGGEVKGFDMDGPESKEFMEKGEFTSEAEGGEINDEMLDQCCGELINAFEKKDKKEMLDSLRAIVLSIKG